MKVLMRLLMQFTRPGRRGDRGGRFQKVVASSAPK
jgi:hypothetical protein